jgi:hypothetical protein
LSDKECVMGCGGEVEVRTLPTEEITWGQEDSKYGRHVFTIETHGIFIVSDVVKSGWTGNSRKIVNRR